MDLSALLVVSILAIAALVGGAQSEGRRILDYAVPLVHIPTYLALVSTMTLGLWPKSLLPAGMLTGTCGLAATACAILLLKAL